MSSAVAIDYVSPLPPVRSGISDYSSDLLPLLDTACDLRVIRLPGQPVTEEIEQRWNPAPVSTTGAGGRLPLYQMGNNEYHLAVMELALERPGVVTLHDVVLHHLLVEMTLGQARLDPYLEHLAADHGWVGEYAAAARQWGELGQAAMFSLPAHRTLLRRQRGVLVHSRWAAERILEEDPSLQVRQIPMGIPLPPEADRDRGLAFRRRLGIEVDSPLIGSMGFQTPIKRTEQVIAALGRPEMEGAHLLIAGEVSPVLDFAAVAQDAGVGDRIHVTGFLDFDEFEQAIAACDICVNLRYPTAGETSASLLRVLAVGRPAIVSDYAHSAELPDQVAIKIPLGEDEVGVLAQRVGDLLGDRPRLREMSLAARRYIEEEHEPRLAAAAVVRACAELGGLEPPGDQRPEPPPPSTLVWREVCGDLEVRGSDPPWPEGESRRLEIRLTNHGPVRWLGTGEGTGGVMIELEWRPDPWQPPVHPQWLELPAALAPGESRDFEIRVRRPLGTAMLIVEPHVQGVSGMNALGGPKWVKFL
jgi:glycosyltransferase involved in cell wall biosynthesis